MIGDENLPSGLTTATLLATVAALATEAALLVSTTEAALAALGAVSGDAGFVSDEDFLRGWI